MKQATLYRVDGTSETVTPRDGKAFTLDELQAYVGGYIEIIELPNGMQICCNEEGRLHGLAENPGATREWKRGYPIERYAFNNAGNIVGDALVADGGTFE